MNKMKYFDCDCMIGLPKVPMPDVEPDMDDLFSEMRRLDIKRALVRHRACIDADHEAGNAVLMDEVSGRDDLLPLWYVTPDGLEGEFDPAAMVRRVLKLGIRAVWTTLGGRDAPYLLDSWCSGKLLGALEEHGLPLLLHYNDVPPNTLKSVLTGFPGLPIILLEAPRLGRNPILYPLMEQHENLVVCVSALYGVHLGLEDLCRRFGDDRIVFGSSYPRCEGGASIAALTYAELPAETKEAIAYGNLERILGKVRM